MKKYQLSKKILKSILSLCDSKGIFNKEFKGNLQIKVTELYGDNIFLVKSNIINLFSSTNAEFNICYAENYFIEESEEKMFKALNKLHRHFNIYELADDFGVDVEIFGIAFSFLHEIGHIYKYIRIINKGKSIEELDRRTKHLYERVDEMMRRGLDGSELYRTISQEREADLFAITFMVDHIYELIDIVQNNVEVVELEEV